MQMAKDRLRIGTFESKGVHHPLGAASPRPVVRVRPTVYFIFLALVFPTFFAFSPLLLFTLSCSHWLSFI